MLLAAAPILAVTLVPTDTPTDPHRLLCIWCGGRASADIILNVLLFVPLGAALGAWLKGNVRSALAALAITIGIELAQIVIPGRDPNLDDVLANSLGAMLGILLMHTSEAWLNPRPRMRIVLLLAAVLLPVGILAAGASLFAPSYQQGVYYGQWTAELGYLEWYRGQVVDAYVGDIRVPSRRLRRTDEVRALLYSRAPIRVDALAGPPVDGLAPILSIYDDREREVMLLGVDRNDAVMRYRMRAANARFDQPDLRFKDGFVNVQNGQPLKLELTGAARGFCLSVNTARSCEVGLRVGDSWGLLFYASTLANARAGLSVIWLAILFVPAGFWLRKKTEIALTIFCAVLALALLPNVFAILPSPLHHYLAAIGGIALGLALQWWYQRAGRRSSRTGSEVSLSARTSV